MDALHCPAESLHTLLRLLAGRGLKTPQLPRTELPADALFNRRARVPLASLLSLLQWAQEELQCQDLALDFGMALALEEGSQPFELNRYLNPGFGDKPTALLAFDLHLRQRDSATRMVELRWRELSGLEPALRPQATYMALAWLHQRWLADISGRHGQMYLALPAASVAQSLAAWLPVEIRTSEPFTGLCFPTDWLENRNQPRRLPGIEGSCDHHQCLLIAHKAANLLRAQLSDAPPLDELARRLGLSERTCKRRLQDCGTHYQKLLGELRLIQASYWLQSRLYNVTAVAGMLGYSSVANFSKAFKKWCGYSPSQVRHGVPAIRQQENILQRYTTPA